MSGGISRLVECARACVRRSRCVAGVRGAGTGQAWRVPPRAAVHRRLCRRPLVRDSSPIRSDPVAILFAVRRRFVAPRPALRPPRHLSSSPHHSPSFGTPVPLFFLYLHIFFFLFLLFFFPF